MRKTTKTIVSAISAIAMISAMTSSMMISANAATKPADTKTTTIQVGVVDYLNKNVANENECKLRVWNDNNESQDIVCKDTHQTEKMSVGQEYWDGGMKTFEIYEAEVPNNFDCYKVHIQNDFFGDQYFGGDGYVPATHQTFVFEYDGKYNASYNYNTENKVVRIGVIENIDKDNNSKDYSLHCWNKNGFVTDTKLVGDGTTQQRSLGSEFWGGEKQTFRMYTAVLPDDATMYKFHIGDRYFGEDANYGEHACHSTCRVAMIFSYDGDRAQYSVY